MRLQCFFEGDRVRGLQDKRESHLPQARLARGRQARGQEVVINNISREDYGYSI